jgi:hypothetical protein
MKLDGVEESLSVKQGSQPALPKVSIDLLVRPARVKIEEAKVSSLWRGRKTVESDGQQ